jgi:hypothetical protein
VLVEVVQHDLRYGVALDRDDDALATAAVRLVGDVGDACEPAVADQVGDVLDQVVRVDLVRELGDDENRATLRVLFGLDHGAHPDRTAAGAVGVFDALGAEDQRLRREVRALDALEQRGQQLVVGGLGVLQRPDHALRDLTQVVRRDVGRHPDRDPGATVDQQVGEAARQDVRLLGTTVVVVREVDGLLFDVGQHVHCQLSEPRLGVPHRGGGVVARRTEVALAVDQRVAHRPRLGETHQRVVDRRVTVRVVVTHHLADDTGTLVVPAVRPETGVVHGVQHPAVHRLKPVADVRQRTGHDHAHGVVDVGPLHLVLDVDRLDTVVFRRQGFRHFVLLGCTVLCGQKARGGLHVQTARHPRTEHPWRCA